MKLNHQTNILALIAAIAVVTLLTVAHFSVTEVRHQNDQITMAENIVKGTTNLRFLIMETAFYNERRSIEQWRNYTTGFSAMLASQRYDDANQNNLLEKQKANLKVIMQLYERMVSNTAGYNAQFPLDEANKERVAGTVSALFLATQSMLDDAFELVRLNRLDLSHAQSEAEMIMQFSIAALALLIAIGCVIVKRRVLKPIAELTRSTERVAQGELNHRLNLNITNEIGLLANAFDRMTGQLEQARKTTQATVQMLANKSDELADMQLQLQTIIDHIPALVDSWDVNFCNRFGNRAYSEWFSMTPDQIRGRHMNSIIGEDLFEQLEPYLLSVLRGNSEIFERTIWCDSGEARHAVFSYVPDVENGVVKGFYGFVSDVTQLKQAQIAKEKVLAQLQGIVDAAQDFAILEGDEKGTITLFSKGAEILLGYKAEEIVGKTDAGVFHVREEIIARSNEMTLQYGRRIRGFDTFVELARQGKSESREWTYVRKDGTTLPVNLTVTAIRNEADAITGYLGIAKDISKEKEILQTLAETRDKAEAASLSKSQFLANMSHEIRTPMNAILGMLQLLQHTEMTTRQLDYVVKTRSAAQSLLGLLNDILDFSKVEANKMTLEFLPFRLDTLMRDLAVIFSSSVGNKEVEVLFATDPKLPNCIVGDVMRLRQVLINLVGNAIKFTKSGEVVISLNVIKQEANRSEIQFSVKDSGIGIAQEQLAYIFEGFTQAEASTTRRFGGTGLGLAISQRLVALMGGELKVESTVNIGSRFYFTISFEHASEVDDDDLRLASLAKEAVQNTTEHRVLIVDDNESAREVLLTMVNSLGWKGETVASGEEALKMLEESELNHCPYDVVFMDWKMPSMDGLETTRKIRQLQRGSPTPVVIMLTAHDREVLAGRLQTDRDLLNGFLVKPVTASMLLDAVTDTSHEPLRTSQKQRVMRLAGLRLLVVEDTKINQQVAQELLSSEGAYVEVADNGLIGVEKVFATTTPFDVVLMDIQMPGMDGYVATGKIREDARMQTLPIIAMTANAMASDKEACKAAGMNDHIAKPVDLDEMVKTILRHCVAKNVGMVAIDTEGQAAQAEVEVSDAPGFIEITQTHMEFDAALQRLGGNTSLFVTLARRFAEDVTPLINDLPHSIEQGDKASVIRIMHTLKGIAGTLGAVALATYAAEVEIKLKATDAPVTRSAWLAELKALITQTTLALDAMVLKMSPAAPSAVSEIIVDKITLGSMLDELDTLLKNKNMRAIHAFSELEKKSGDQFKNQFKNQLPLIAQAINRLDFKLALEHSRQLRTRLDSNEPI